MGPKLSFHSPGLDAPSRQPDNDKSGIYLRQKQPMYFPENFVKRVGKICCMIVASSAVAIKPTALRGGSHNRGVIYRQKETVAVIER